MLRQVLNAPRTCALVAARLLKISHRLARVPTRLFEDAERPSAVKRLGLAAKSPADKGKSAEVVVLGLRLMPSVSGGEPIRLPNLDSLLLIRSDQLLCVLRARCAPTSEVCKVFDGMDETPFDDALRLSPLRSAAVPLPSAPVSFAV